MPAQSGLTSGGRCPIRTVETTRLDPSARGTRALGSRRSRFPDEEPPLDAYLDSWCARGGDRSGRGGCWCWAAGGAGTSPAAENVYGAIAISQRTGNTAYAINYATASAAKRAAEAKCRASDCRWVVQMARNCGAVTQQPRTLRWGWAYAPTRRSAEVAAANESGPGSRTIIWACTAGA
ncbi:DUF4189 domain-containing protein [Gordonia sp. CNJ-863]|uniref:DUF4189 domain-containing protein n=1 Tax=Gordonia sp. CNJ-863 TaxID=1904963 RepID=UPI00096A2B8B|nr:DUF4189 domain-containing protein [Gordonia sp. CNJ-863]